MVKWRKKIRKKIKMTQIAIEKIKNLIESGADHIELLVQENIMTGDEVSRLAQNKAIKTHSFSIRISSELLELISAHDQRISDIELVIGPIRDAQTTSKTITSWSKAYPWVFALMFAASSWIYHFMGAPQ